jgi:hypothetical protein
MSAAATVTCWGDPAGCEVVAGLASAGAVGLGACAVTAPAVAATTTAAAAKMITVFRTLAIGASLTVEKNARIIPGLGELAGKEN